MKQNNLLLVCAIALLLITGAIVLCGCGATPGSGGASSSSSRNMGTISGNIGIFNETFSEFEPVVGALVSVSTEAMSVEVTSTSDAQGNYSLKGLPSGEVQLDVSAEGYVPCAAVEDLDRLDFVIGKKQPAITELTTIQGTIEGIPTGFHIHCYNIYANAYNNLYRYMPVTYESSTNTYEARNVPVGDTIYVMARADDAADNYTRECLAYNKIVTGNGVNYMSISFEPMVSIEALCTLPSGFSVNGHGSYISAGNKFLLMIMGYSGPLSNNFTIERLPRLKSGDSYLLEVSDENIYDDSLVKYYYGVDQSKIYPDLSTPAVPSGSLLVYPGSRETISDTATFEWQSVSWADFYELWVYDKNINLKWVVWTHKNKVKMPKKVWDKLPVNNPSDPSDFYMYQVYAYKFKNFPSHYNVNHIAFNINWQYDYVYCSNTRAFKKL